MFILERFGTVRLPYINPVIPLQTGTARSALARAADGSYDAIGGQQAALDAMQITYSGRIIEDDSLDVQTSLDAYEALVGMRDRIYRRMPDGNVRWITARLMSVTARQRQLNTRVLDIDFVFEVGKSSWNGFRHGDGWFLDSGEYLDTGLVLDEEVGDEFSFPASGNVVVNNGGKFRIKNAILTITAAGSSITDLVISKSGQSSLRYNGTIAAGNSLVMDCGKFTVLNNGVDDFAHFSRYTGHMISDWLVLDPGDNTIALTRTGGNDSSSIVFSFNDGWA